MRALARHWYLLVIAALAVALWQNQRAMGSMRAELRGEIQTGLERIGRDSTIVRTEPMVIQAPNLVDRLLKSEDWKRWQAEFRDRLSEDMRAALDGLDTEAEAVTTARVEVPGDSVTVRWGETASGPRFSLNIPEPEHYHLTVFPVRLALDVVEAEDGSILAEARDLTTGDPLRVLDFEVRRRAPSTAWRWLRWEVGAGYGSDADGSGGPTLWGTVTALRLEPPGGLRWDIGTVSVDRYAAWVGVSVGN